MAKVESIFINESTQVNADWNAVSGVAQILNKPNITGYELLSNKVDNLNTPNTTTYPDTNAVTTYVDGVLSGLNSANAVQVATSAILPNTPTYNNGSSGVGATLQSSTNVALIADGYTLLLGDDILVKDEGNAAHNGRYILSQLGDGTHPWILTRDTAYDTPTEINNTGTIPVANNGIANKLTSWLLVSNITTIGVDSFIYQKFTFTPNTIALNTNGLSQFPNGSTSSANLATLLTDETGTGSVVFSNAPTITNPVITGIINGGINGNSATATTLATPRNINNISFDGSASILLNTVVNDQVGISYTFVLSDNQKLVTSSNSSAQTYTIPPHSSIAFPAGAKIDVLQLGTGKLTIAAGSGVTIISFNSLKSAAGQGVGLTLQQGNTQDVWYLFGNLIA